MTAEQELIEKVALWLAAGSYIDEVEHEVRLEEAKEILTMAKEVGYKSPEECDACADGFISTYENEDNRIAWAKASGYVLLVENQDLPACELGLSVTQLIELKQAGWRKVKLST